jgi:hypothetical protein
MDEGVSEAWRALGKLMQRLGGWDVVVLAPERGLEKLLGIEPSWTLRVKNGGVACRVFVYGPA